MSCTKFILKRFIMSIIRQLAKAKTKGRAEGNHQLVNINEGSAKDKDIDWNLSRNSKLVFPKALNIM